MRTTKTCQYKVNIKFSKNQSMSSAVTTGDAQTHSDVTSLFTWPRNARCTISSGSVRVQTKQRTPCRSNALPHAQMQLQYGLHETHKLSTAPRGNLLIPQGHKPRSCFLCRLIFVGLLHDKLVAPRIFRWFLNFWKIFEPSFTYIEFGPHRTIM
jgi:hypothetical protein